LAWAEPAGPLAFAEPDRVATAATTVAGGWTMTGTKDDVADLGAAEQVVVVARTDDGPALFLVPLPASGATVTMRSTTDRTRRIGTLALDGTPANALATGERARAVLDAVALRATTALALESVGVAQRVFDLAAEHAKTREQFGRVIGTYQAVSHRVADAYVRLELARSLAYRAAWAVETREADADEVSAQEASVAAAQAKAAAADAAVFGAEAAIQVLGGTGFTWEHVTQRYYKRALANQSWAGAPAVLRALVAADLLT
jgi:alkylation response protein AidB-like acyl-CoA dehydrogenase